MKSSSKVLIALGLALGLALLLGAAPPAAEKKAVVGAAKPVGPYSPGVDIGNLVFVAGQIGLDPGTGKLVEGGIDAQTTQVMKNAEAVLKNAGLGFKDVVRTTVFLADIKDFQAMNKIYAGYFPEGTIPPARSTVAVAALAALVGFCWFGVSPLAAAGLVVLEGALALCLRRRILPVIDPVRYGTVELFAVVAVFRRLERERFTTPYLARLGAALDVDGTPASDALARLASLV